MTKELKEEVKELIAAAIAVYHRENVERLGNIEKRLIGIDGNGTGSRGVLQQMGETIDETKDDIKTIKESVASLTLSDTTWNKEKMLKGFGWFILAAVAVMGLMFTALTYWHAQHPHGIIIGAQSSVVRYDSEVH